MRYISFVAVSITALTASVAFAQAPPSNVKLSQSECTSLWQQANGSGKGLTAAQSAPYVSDFKAANPDGDTTIDQNEWIAACNKGLVKSASSSGASTGEAGKTSDRTPGNPSPDRTPNASDAGAAGADAAKTPGGTSDRTPSK